MYDVIVVGAGAMGSAAAYALSKRGKTTLLIEQFPLPHTRGSSHGGSRITRVAYPEKYNGNIMAVANPMWQALEEESGMTLLRKAGLLITSSAQHSTKLSQYRDTIQDNSEKTIPIMDAQTLSDEYHPMRFASDETGCFDETAGVLYASKCLVAFQKVFERNGGVIADNQKVLNITPGETITVHTNRGSFQSKGVILTCGPWASQMLDKVGIQLPLETEAIQVCYWRARPGVDHNALPCVISYPDVTHAYGLPPDEYTDMMKICLHYGSPCDPDLRDAVDSDKEAEDLAKLKEFVAQVFPGLIPEPAIKERCLYTCTPDEVCVVDHHPKYKNIAYAAGLSGHGFKQAPVIGEILADLVLHQKSSTLLAKEMRAERFTAKANL